MYNRKPNLITNRGLQNNLKCNSPEIEQDIDNSLIEIQQTIHQAQVVRANLPRNAPFEKHPYLDQHQLQDFEKYIIGTCPPVSYLCDSLDVDELITPNGDVISKPNVSFFHGNKLDQWKMFLTNEEWTELDNLDRAGKKHYLISKLVFNEINYSDIIKTFQRVNTNYSVEDKHIRNICTNSNLILHILKNPNAKYLNFNTSSVFNIEGLKVYINNQFNGKVNVNKINSYNLFLRTLQDFGFDLNIDLLNGDGWIGINALNADYLINHYKSKVLTKLKISSNKCINIDGFEISNIDKIFTIVTGPSPSGFANLQLGNNPVYANWNIQNQLDINAFRKQIYSHFRNNEFDQLQAMNI